VHRPFLDSHLYSWEQIALYVGGFLAWTPAYVVIVCRGVKRHELEEPVIAALGNVTWEFFWGFFVRVNMGWGLQLIYQGACILDLVILFVVVRYGYKQFGATAFPERLWPLLVAAMIAGWLAFYASFHHQGYDLPLGSNSAYLDNVVVSSLYLWFGLTRHPDTLSLPVAWSKFVGTGMVSVFVFLRYGGNDFVRSMAVLVAVLDVSYLVLLYARSGRLPAMRDGGQDST
jgi:hypothetical protein